MEIAQLHHEKLKSAPIGKVGLGLFVVGAIASVGAFFVDKQQFYFAYLNAYMLWLAMGLGALFFTMLHHIVGAEWSIVIRRIAESIMVTIPFMAILFIPILLGMHDLYHWSHEEAVAEDPILQHKAVWLNATGFTVRSVIYFAIWSVLAMLLYKASKEQDETGSPAVTAKMKKISAPGILLFSLSISFAGWDWVMSLDPHWFSTMFGVYTFAGSWWVTLAFISLITQYIRKKAELEKYITIEHFHDLGKLMFGFTIFWGYIAFSQFMLIWYANLPEETAWFRHRWEDGWMPVSAALMAGHFVIPFLVLLFRASKRSFGMLKFMAIWFMVVQWLDYFWLMAPTLHSEGHGHGFFAISWMHIATVTCVGGAFLAIFWNRLTSTNVIPIKDPKLQTSIDFLNS